MTTTSNTKTKEGFTVWSKVEDGEIYHYVPRDERLTYLQKKEILVTVEKVTTKKGLVTVTVTLGLGSDYHQGIGSCRIANPNTEDHVGLAYKKAIDNALQTMGVGVTLKDGSPISSLNRGVTAEEAIENALNSQLP